LKEKKKPQLNSDFFDQLLAWLVSVTHACNPSFLEGKDQEDFGLIPVWVNSK
jgi:hypothetical protein